MIAPKKERKARRGIHTRPGEGETVEWLTPPEILKALGPFDLDPCAPADRPWDMAARHYTRADDGLSLPWGGVVWLNPPYSAAACDAWLSRLAEHGNGLALVAARTETEWFQQHVWGKAGAVLFLRGRLYFHLPDGSKASGNAGHGSVIAAYGPECVRRLARSGLPGRFVRLSASRRGRRLARKPRPWSNPVTECPNCKSDDIGHGGTRDSGQSVVRYRKCRACGHRWKEPEEETDILPSKE